MLFIVDRKIGKRTAAELLVGLSQFAAYRRLARTAKHIGCGKQRRTDAVGRFKEDQCRRCVCEFRETVSASLVLGRQEARKEKGVVWQA